MRAVVYIWLYRASWCIVIYMTCVHGLLSEVLASCTLWYVCVYNQCVWCTIVMNNAVLCTVIAFRHALLLS